MSTPKHERDSDRESLTDWTLVDREGTPDKTTREGAGKDDDKDSGKKSSSPAKEESKEEVDKEKNEPGGGTEEEEGEELSEDLISMGKRVQEIKGESVKASSGSDSSDIETLDCPSPDDCYEDSNQGYSSLHSSLLSSSLSGFTFVEEADEGDVESLASSDVLVLDQEGKGADEETDLSLASSPSLPDDLPAIKPDTQYKHTPDRELNSRLNVVVALTLACVLGLGLGHFLGWSSRSLWQENLNSAQVRRLRELQDDLLSCINSPPQVEPETGGPEYLPDTSFIPVLNEAEAEGAANVETFVESLVVPLEDAGVVLDQQHHHHHHHLGESRHTYQKHVHTESMEPTFATLDLLYGSSDSAPASGQEQEARIHSGLPGLSMATAAEDEIESPLPQPVLPTKTVEPTINEETPPTASPTNTLPPIELNPEHEIIPTEEEQQPTLQFAEVSGEEDTSSPVPVENSQIIEALNLENEQLKSEITRLQHVNLSPIKISGKDGKDARNLRERITHLLEDNEELRVAALKQQFAGLPDGDTTAFDDALSTNFKLRLSVGKLTHLVPDLTTLKVSANDLQKENQDLQKQVGKLRYQEQPLPQELNIVAREVENLKKVVDEASKKKKLPPNYENAKMYLSYMSQVLQTLHDFNEGNLVEKLDVATDVFEGLVPGNVKPSASVQQKLNAVRGKFKQLKSSLASKWEKIKELSHPQHLTQVSQDTLSKMNRVVVNVVNKMKDIGQASIMKRGKASVESTVASLAQSLAALGDQFDKTWKNLEGEVSAEGKEDSGELLVGGEVGAQTEEEEEEVAVDAGEGGAKETQPRDARDGASGTTSHIPNKSKKVDRRSGGSGEGGQSGGRDGGDDKNDPKEKESRTIKAEKKKEDKPDGRLDGSRSDKKEKKEEEKEKKGKSKDENGKKKKDKENKKSKKDKDESNKNRKSKDREGLSHMKKDDWSSKNIQQDDKRYYKGQYNKYDKKQQRLDDDDDDDSDSVGASDEDDHASKLREKHHKKKHYDDDDDEKFKRKYQQKVIQKDDEDDNDDDDDDDDDKKKGLLRHWEKPSRKNYRREYPGPKKAFIRRRGKNATVHLREEEREWTGRRATGRETRRKEEQKADWQFERAKHRSQKRDEEHKAEWQFDRARDRREKRIIGDGVDERRERKRGNHEKNSHNKHERHQAKRRYVRFDDDDDDDDFGDDDYEFYHHHHHHHNHHHHEERGRGERKHYNNKGKREWVIPNFSATGKTFYH